MGIQIDWAPLPAGSGVVYVASHTLIFFGFHTTHGLGSTAEGGSTYVIEKLAVQLVQDAVLSSGCHSGRCFAAGWPSGVFVSASMAAFTR